MPIEALEATGLKMKSLSIYRKVLSAYPLNHLVKLVDCLLQENIDTAEVLDTYSSLFYGLSCRNDIISLRECVLEKMLFDENPFTIQASFKPIFELDRHLLSAVRHDLAVLEHIAGISSGQVSGWIRESVSVSGAASAELDNLPEWNSEPSASPGITLLDMPSNFRMEHDWDKYMGDLAAYHKRRGNGLFSTYRALIWKNFQEGLQGIENPDPVRLSDLVGYELSRGIVIENTLSFLQGKPANNVLLYGDRGTGKSSTVKAILNEYFEEGLRIIELPRNQLLYFNDLVAVLNKKSLKFIIFIDDLAFEDNEENYTSLKALLEGSVEKRPRNVLIYATSNRRHLIREKFSDRYGLQSANADDEIRAADTIQEKLSLSDRFGITAYFPSPDKNEFLKIVEGIADKAGIEMDKNQLFAEAMKWELRYNGRSPRTARQFIDWLLGQKG